MSPSKYYQLAFMSLILGMLIYVLFREPVIFTLPAQYIGASLPLINLPDCIVTKFFLNHVPDAFWCFSLLFYRETIQQSSIRFIAIVIIIGFELMQLSSYFPGTFDYIDLAIYLIIILIFEFHGKKS